MHCTHWTLDNRCPGAYKLRGQRWGKEVMTMHPLQFAPRGIYLRFAPNDLRVSTIEYLCFQQMKVHR